MIKKTLLFACIFLSFFCWSQKPIFTQAKIESAKVYYNGAELTHSVSIDLPKGTSEIVISNIANHLDENTIQIGSIGEVSVMSTQFSNTYIEEYDNSEKSPLTKDVRDSIKLVETQLKKLQNTKQAELKTIELLDKNQSLGGTTTGFTVAELSKMVEYYKSKRNELSNSLDVLIKKEKDLTKKLENLKSRLATNLGKEKSLSKGKLIVQVMNEKAGKVPFKISYIARNAQWSPFYDLRIDQISKPIKMHYRAEVTQNTGVDWVKINMNLISGQVNRNNQIPQWNTWFVDYEEIMNAPYKKNTVGYLNERAMYKESALEEPAAVQSSIKSVSVKENQLNISFDLDTPYTVLSNGKKHSANLKDFSIPGKYIYYTTPKMDLNAYLISTVKDYGNYNLLPGTANVIFDGLYVGKTYLNPSDTEEDLKLNIGKDSKVIVNRTLVTDKSGTKMLSSRKVQNYVYEISVRNNKSEEIEIKIEDQYPISSNTDIEIELTEKTGATIDSEKGILSWNLKVKPNKTEKIRFGYQVKSAKNKKISSL